MIEVIPGFASRHEIADVVSAIPPRDLLLVSASNDEYSADADQVLQQANLQSVVDHVRVNGGHELDPFRFEAIANWVA
ncbi:MAG TPA: hypothetical protein VHW01_20490, partial [Polyangiaceae bacterium]|nr:hypothetical protein [Polyangiaceae bacterium]